jgi:hypothetical protein
LNVDRWSGNHPYYTGSEKLLNTKRRVERFIWKYDFANLKHIFASKKNQTISVYANNSTICPVWPDQ